MTLREGERAQLVAWARGALPCEACGLLVGSAVDGAAAEDSHVVSRVTLSRNLAGADGRTRFVLDPAHWVRMEEEASRQGLGVIGVWHSHPGEKAAMVGAEPSARDAAGALPGWSYLIISIDDSEGACLRSWRMSPEAGGAAPMLEERIIASS